MARSLSFHGSALRSAISIAVLTLFAVFPPDSHGAGRDYSRELIVGFKPGATPANRLSALRHASANKTLAHARLTRQGLAAGPSTELVRLADGVDAGSEIARLRQNPEVAFVEPNYPIHLYNAAQPVVPDDFFFSSMYGLRNEGLNGSKKGADIRATEAWALTTGSKDVIVAVIDTGVDYLHEDLRDNIWVNTGEIPGNGLDDDGNGYVDDVNGFDFVSNDSDPMDDLNHGTHVAGTIGARGNNQRGVAGVCWDISMMALKAFDETGNGSVADAVEAIRYAVDNGARIISASWGLDEQSRALEDAVSYATSDGVLFIAASGNEKNDEPNYPAGFEDVISVAATNAKDERAGFSNYGADVDIAAPGDEIFSTLPENGYGLSSGTSMATPFVSGVAALVLSRYPHYTREELRDVIINSIDPLVTDRPLGRGRINALTAVEMDQPLPQALLEIGESLSGETKIFGTAAGPFATGYSVQIGRGNDPTEWIEAISSTTLVTNGVLGTLDSAAIPDGAAAVKLVVTNANGHLAVDLVRLRIVNSSITSPRSGDILRPGPKLEIRGTVYGTNRTYSLLLGSGVDPKQWTELGTGTSTKEVNRLLGVWDTAQVEADQFYILKMVVRDSIRTNEFTAPGIYLESHLRPGWPRHLPNPRDFPDLEWRNVRAADLDGDGRSEIVIVDSGSIVEPAFLRVFNLDGTELWSRDVGTGTGSDTPALGDIDRDGKVEIFVDGRKRIYGFRADGTALDGAWPLDVPAGNLAKVLADLDRDGALELITFSQDPLTEQGTDSSHLRVYSGAGAVLDEWRVPWCGFTNDVQKIFPLAVNLDSDPSLELIAVSGCNEIVCYDPGRQDAVWRAAMNGAILSSPIAADLDGDGEKEIIVATAAEKGFSRGGIYVIANNGQIWPGWPVLEDVSFIDTPAVGDVNQDGRLEIAVASATSFNLHLVEMDGFEAEGWPVTLRKGTARVSPSIAPVDGTGIPRVVLAAPGYMSLALLDRDEGYIGGLLAFDYQGKRVSMLGETGLNSLPMEAVTSRKWHKAASAIVADLDGDGYLEALASSVQDRTFGSAAAFKNRSSLYVWDLGVPLPERGVEWAMFGNNSQNNAVYDLLPLPYNPGPTNVTRAVTDRLVTIEDHPAILPVLTNDINAGPGLLRILSFTQPAHGLVTRELAGNLYFRPETNFSGGDEFEYTIRDLLGVESTAKVKLLIKGENDRPIAFDQALEMTKNKELGITYMAEDAEGDPLTFRIVTPPQHGELWNYPAVGNYVPPKGFFGTDSFAYTAHDGKNESAPATVFITIINSNNPPRALDQFALTKPNRSAAVRLSADDPDGDPLTFELASQPQHGSVFLTNGNQAIYTPLPDYAGEDRFHFRAFDGTEWSLEGVAAIHVILTNSIPVAQGGSVQVQPNSQQNITLSARDPDGDPITYTVVTLPMHGTLKGVPPDLIYQPASGFLGPDRLTFAASDAQTSSAPAEVSIEVARVNRPPNAADMAVTTRTNTPAAIVLKAGDEDTDPLRGIILKGPVRGRIFGTGVRYTYIPDADFSGADSFTYRVWDGERFSGTATIQILVNTFAGPALPTLGTPGLAGVGILEGELSVRSDRRFRIETSTNLQEWTPLIGPESTESGSYRFQDTNAVTSSKFYRAVLEP